MFLTFRVSGSNTSLVLENESWSSGGVVTVILGVDTYPWSCVKSSKVFFLNILKIRSYNHYGMVDQAQIQDLQYIFTGDLSKIFYCKANENDHRGYTSDMYCYYQLWSGNKTKPPGPITFSHSWATIYRTEILDHCCKKTYKQPMHYFNIATHIFLANVEYFR